jgi:hypothetical protein
MKKKYFPSENIHARTQFLVVISRGTDENHIFLELIAGKNAPSRNTFNKIGSPRYSWKWYP